MAKARLLKAPKYGACPNNVKRILCVEIRCESRWGWTLPQLDQERKTLLDVKTNILNLFYLFIYLFYL